MATTKKNVGKMETPIDQRETFVSLQKNFADSSLGVEEKLGVLYNLQKADNEIEKIVQLRGELPVEVQALEEELVRLRAKVERLGEAIAEKNVIIEAAKANAVQHEADIAKYSRQLEDISNSREYDSISKELENTNLLRQIDQKNITEAKEKIEEYKQGIEELNDRITIREQDLAAKNEELGRIVEGTAGEEEKLRERREGFASKLDERTMSAYERIRASVRNHLAVVPVYNGNACGGCFNTITPQRLVDIASGGKLVICEHCGRIIVGGKAE
ncbi:MAG: hypothetical protein K6F58_00460 [Bacteroidales bacterium]|nr:hypothetical protein [Bacteroidales bacterium]